MIYRITHNDNCLSAIDFFEYSQNNTRGHPYKITIDFVSSTIRKTFYAVRVRNAWNSLPSNIDNKPLLLARNAGIFKILLGRVDLNMFYTIIDIRKGWSERAAKVKNKGFSSISFKITYIIHFFMLIPNMQKFCPGLFWFLRYDHFKIENLAKMTLVLLITLNICAL